ncbi:MAG: GNAT family N-acetyltransferase [Actinomycetota bacterium]
MPTSAAISCGRSSAIGGDGGAPGGRTRRPRRRAGALADADAPESATDDGASLERLLAHPTSALLLAVEGDSVVGTLIVAWDGWRGGLYRLVVAPGSRRAGVASTLVAEGEERLREVGCRRVSILVLRGHDHAAGFWTAAGYDLDERLDRYVKSFDTSDSDLGAADIAR